MPGGKRLPKKQIRGKGSIGSEILARIYHHFPDLNLLWLISGEGEMLVPENEIRTTNNQVEEEKIFYTKDERIEFLNERIALLESSLTDKKRIIELLEKSTRKKEEPKL